MSLNYAVVMTQLSISGNLEYTHTPNTPVLKIKGRCYKTSQ